MEDEPIAPLVGASVWENKLFEHLTHHAALEGEILAEYVSTAENTESKAMAYLVNLLVEDERRHHRYFHDLALSLKTDAELSSEDPVVPRLDFRKADSEELLAVTERLLQHEKDDAAELKDLRKEIRDLEDTTLWGLLVDIMIRDTEKHMEILKFVVHHAKPERHLFHKS
ncbi:MAG: hypothetical protein KUG57_01440 [Ilumatobacteraceae bacterium]|nr:hypothetical protein [Ilumatobacteraceae bacterium]